MCVFKRVIKGIIFNPKPSLLLQLSLVLEQRKGCAVPSSAQHLTFYIVVFFPLDHEKAEEKVAPV